LHQPAIALIADQGSNCSRGIAAIGTDVRRAVREMVEQSEPWATRLRNRSSRPAEVLCQFPHVLESALPAPGRNCAMVTKPVILLTARSLARLPTMANSSPVRLRARLV
jgi:hypothetical protein